LKIFNHSLQARVMPNRPSSLAVPRALKNARLDGIHAQATTSSSLASFHISDFHGPISDGKTGALRLDLGDFLGRWSTELDHFEARMRQH
jgi:hypothetical protein